MAFVYFSVDHDSEWINMTAGRTKQAIWGCHLGLRLSWYQNSKLWYNSKKKKLYSIHLSISRQQELKSTNQPVYSAGTENNRYQHRCNNVNICAALGWKSDWRFFFYSFSTFDIFKCDYCFVLNTWYLKSIYTILLLWLQPTIMFLFFYHWLICQSFIRVIKSEVEDVAHKFPEAMSSNVQICSTSNLI